MPKSLLAAARILLFALAFAAAPPAALAVDYVPEETAEEAELAPEPSTETVSGAESRPDYASSSAESGSGAIAPITAPSLKSGGAGLAPGATKKPLRVPLASLGGSGGGGLSVPEIQMYNCRMPNRKPTVEAVRKRPGMEEALGRLCRNKTDWTFLDAVIDELRKTDKRWGYFCRRGKCGDPSHDVLSYYCGPGKAWSGADNAVGVDFVVASCYDPGDGATPGIGWGVFEEGNPVGTSAWTSRGRF